MFTIHIKCLSNYQYLFSIIYILPPQRNTITLRRIHRILARGWGQDFPPWNCFVQKVNTIKVHKKGVTEVRSKILTPLETTGGNSFSLEGFQKMLFITQNFTQGDLHFTGGIQMSFLWGYNSTGGIQLSFLGVYNSTGGVQISFLGIF